MPRHPSSYTNRKKWIATWGGVAALTTACGSTPFSGTTTTLNALPPMVHTDQATPDNINAGRCSIGLGDAHFAITATCNTGARLRNWSE